MFYFLLIFFGATIDQIIKFLIVKNLMPIGEYGLIKGVISLRYIENQGAAFSIFENNRFVLTVIPIIGLLAITLYLVKMIREKNCDLMMKLGLALIISGGISNLVDRIRIGYVVDFIELKFVRFAIFNVADIFIVAGVVMLMISLIFKRD